MPQHLVCPGCQQRLIIRDGSPATLTCPNCLALIRNPDVLSSAPPPPPPEGVGSAAPAQAAVAPLPVIPLDQEVNDDFQGAVRNLVVLSIVVMAGGILSAITLDAGIVASALIGFGVVMLIVLSVVYRRQLPRPAPIGPAQ